MSGSGLIRVPISLLIWIMEFSICLCTPPKRWYSKYNKDDDVRVTSKGRIEMVRSWLMEQGRRGNCEKSDTRKMQDL